MKRLTIISILSLILFVSCASLNNTNRVDVLDRMGKEGNLVLTAKGEYLKVDKIDRISAELSRDSINGIVEGNFSKFVGFLATTNIDLSSYGIVTESMDYYQPYGGLIAFSENDAQSYYESIVNDNSLYINPIDLDQMKQSDFALFSKDFLLLLAKDGYWSATIFGSDVSSTRALLSAIKSSYVAFLTVHNISFDVKELINHFEQDDCKIIINNLPLNNGYFSYFVEEFLSYGR